MTLRTGKGSAGGMYRYYTCSTKARQGERGRRGLTVPMDKLDRAVADHLEWQLLDPARLTTMMDQLLERRERSQFYTEVARPERLDLPTARFEATT